MRRFFEFIVDQFVAFMSNISDLIEIVISLPQTLLGVHSESSMMGRILMLAFQVVWFPVYAIGWLLLLPLRMFTDFSPDRRVDFMWGLPALLMMGLVALTAIYVNASSDNIESRYRNKGQDLMAAGNMPAAKTYLGRVISTNKDELEDSDLFNWALILSQTGESKRASAIMDKLAPFERTGYNKAHRLKAISLAQTINQNLDPLKKRKLRWHLENSRDESTEVMQSWAVYYLSIEQPEKAITPLKKAASDNPANLIDIAKIEKQLGRASDYRTTVEEAERRFRKLVDQDPLNTKNRVTLANALVQLEKVDDAEKVLLTGLKMQPDEFIRRSISDFYVMRHDQIVAQKGSFQEQMKFLKNAMSLDVNYPPIYQRFVALYRNFESQEELQEVKQAIMESISSDSPSALAHFALSNVLWMENQSERAEWHLEQAYNLEPNFVVVLNNLAWTLANKDAPDLDRAFDLAKKVLQRSPEDARFRDTYATVLMKQGKDDEAIREFEKALLSIENKKPLHQKLAVLYERMGRLDLAAMHARKVEN